MTVIFKRTRIVQIGALLAAVALAWFSHAQNDASGSTSATPALQCKVSSVHDGDTLRAQCPGQRKSARIRIHQIDAPELDQKYGIASRDFLRGLCRRDEPVHITVVSTDQYDRLLANIQCDGKDVATTMVASGAAWVYEQYVKDQRLVDAQKKARQARAGLWQDHDPTAPWQFRRNQRQ